MASNPAMRVGNKRGHGADLREEILAAAERLLAVSGSREAVTLRAIAREAGIAAPSIYPHFADRDAILDTVVARTFTSLAEFCGVAATATTGVARVEAICGAYLTFAHRNPGWYRVLFDRSTANITAPPHKYPEGINAFALLTDAIETVAAQNPTCRIDPTLDAQTLFVALHGIATLPAALPAFAWRNGDDLVSNAITKTLGLN